MHAILRSPLEIIFGAGQRRTVPQVAAQLGQRAFVVIDPFLTTSSEFAEMLSGLRDIGITTTVYSDVVPELPTSGIARCVEAAREFGPDVFIAVGGGSSIDMAKLTAVVLAHGGQVSDYYGERQIPGPVAALIAIPTTAGTGSEVTPVAVVTDDDRQAKVGISSPYLIPKVAVCDPELTLTCPASVTAASGADALCHAIEAFTARKHDPSDMERVFMGSSALTDTLALDAIRAIATGLPRAWRDPSDLEARTLTMYGALLAGLAFGTAGTAAAHALQYPIGAATRTPHGVGVGLLLPYVMANNAAAQVSEFAQIARALGAEPGVEDALARCAPEMVQKLLQSIGIPSSLADIGFPRDRLEWAATEGMLARRLADNNPVALTTELALGILESAYSGTLTLPAMSVAGDAQ